MPSFDDEIQTFIMRTAWVGGLEWAIGNPDLIADYERDTGHKPYSVPEDMSGRMVDNILGFSGPIGLFIFDFAEWFNVNVWGDME